MTKTRKASERLSLMLSSLHGVTIPHLKNTSGMASVRMNPPETVILPMSMHIGKPAVPVVKPGEHVDVGQLVGEQNGYISSPVYASVSGTVKKIEDVLLSSGAYVPAVYIASDGLMTMYPEIKPPVISCKEDFTAAVRSSGIVGLGGAGFPTYVKFDIKEPRELILVVNCAECEPYITSDTRTVIEDTEYLAEGIGLIEKYTGAVKTVIGIEKGSREALLALAGIASKDKKVEVKPLPSYYPQGGEKVLVYNTTGRVIPVGKLPLDVGVIVCNCTTIAAIAKYIKTGIPLTEKRITVDGSAVSEPGNVIVPIGTPLRDVIAFRGGYSRTPGKILYGGPMMGISVPFDTVPVLKNTNAVIALSEKDAVPPKSTQCIHCARCVAHCPFSLSPTAISKAYKKGDGAELERLRVDTCMECGCCSFICPAKRPLVQTNKLAKVLLREYRGKKAAREKELQKEKGV